jgi:hypothetical protein
MDEKEKRESALILLKRTFACAHEMRGLCINDMNEDPEAIVVGADVWLRRAFASMLATYMHIPLMSIVREHGIESGIAYLNVLRNATFDNRIDTVTKVWRRETLGDFIEALQAIITPPAAEADPTITEEPCDEQRPTFQAIASAEPSGD